MLRVALVLIVVFASIPVFASDHVHVCAKYTNSGAKYSVDAVHISGSELNIATSTLKYDALSYYVVIFWQQGEASLIKMNFPVLTPIGDDGVDQEGRHWNIAETDFCF